MTNAELTQDLFLLLLLIGLAPLLGWLFVKMRQPKVIGEILAGVVLGNALIGRLPIAGRFIDSAKHEGNVLDFVYWLGLLLLMFLAGAERQQLFTRDERREVGWLTIVGTGLPFVLGLLFAPWLIRPSLAGPNGNRISLTIILAVSAAVTSVPVVSKIFADLKILHTRFARLILSVAVLEDIVLWLALAVATAAAGEAVLDPPAMSYRLAATVTFFVLGLTIAPRLIKHINKSRFNVLARYSPAGYAIAVLLACCVVAGALNIGGRTCIVKISSVSLAARFAGCRGLDLIKLAITKNAREGPDIVLASVAFDAGIISSKLYTTLVVAAVLTSQIAGARLDYLLRKRWPLLASKAAGESAESAPEFQPLA